MKFSIPWFKNSWLKISWLKGPKLKLGVEKSGVEKSFNPRFFVKNALLQGHSVTALCRAADNAAALARMEDLLAGTTLTEGGLMPTGTPGKLTASNSNIFKAETFKRLLTEDPSIDALCCFVGYGNTGCGVFKRGIQNWKDFCIRINIPKGNY